MENEKIIEKMARDICECYNNDGTCYQDDMPCDLKCEHMTEAQFLYDKGYRKERQGEWISVEERLPNENETVLIWDGSVRVAKFIKGITEEEREKMNKGELPNPKDEYWCSVAGYTLIERSKIHKSCDVWCNNLVPYCWEIGGGVTQLFGQNVSHWMPLPEPPKMKGAE